MRVTSPRHPRSLIRAALRLAVVVCAGVGTAAGQPPPGGEQAPGLALTPAWTTLLPGPPAAPPANDGERLYVPLRAGGVIAIAVASGQIAWQARTLPGAFVAAGGGLVFAAFPGTFVPLDASLVLGALPGVIVALDAASGTERWRLQVEGTLAAPPVWNNGWLLIGTTDGRLTMLRAEQGRPLWRRDLGAALLPGAAMTGDWLYTMLDDGRVVALTLDRGEPVWERKLPAGGTTLTALDDRVFVGADDRFFYCLSTGDGDVKWRWRAGGAILGTPIVDGNSVYFLALDNTLRALNYGNGHQRWKRGLSFRPVGGPVLAGSLLLVPGLAQEVPAFRAATGAPAGKIVVGDELVAPPLMVSVDAPGAEANADTFSIVVVTGEFVQRLAPAPPVLESHPIPGLPAFLPLPGSGSILLRSPPAPSGSRALLSPRERGA
jgi:outer membrane protein assembly factor BamB